MTDGVGIYFEEHRESKDLGRRALRSGVVSIAMKYGNGVLQIAAAIVLARLLTPEDFGLVAIVTVLTSFAPLLIDFGLGDATTQRDKITPTQISSLFWVSTGIGCSARFDCRLLQPAHRKAIRRAQAAADCTVDGHDLRTLWAVE